jgi:hypothetical protein
MNPHKIEMQFLEFHEVRLDHSFTVIVTYNQLYVFQFPDVVSLAAPQVYPNFKNVTKLKSKSKYNIKNRFK